jgi:hypothetical protein
MSGAKTLFPLCAFIAWTGTALLLNQFRSLRIQILLDVTLCRVSGSRRFERSF